MIIVRLYGGMGNQMFQYALGRSLAIKNNTTVGLDLSFLLDRTPQKNFTFREFDLDVFTIQAEIIPESKVPFLFQNHGILLDKLRRKFLKQKGTEKYFAYDPAIMSLGEDTYLEGYWQSPKYFSSIEDIIRQDFVIKHTISEKTTVLQKEIMNTESLCIHVRRGDYVGHSYHDVSIGQQYYNEGIQQIKKTVAVQKIYVFSDDIAWCKNNLQFDIETMFVGPEYAGQKGEEHLLLMSSCKHFVIANSSFSWWAAWLASNPQKIVIAPKQWLKDATIDTRDLLPEQWIRI